VVLLIEGLSLYDFQAHESLFPAIADIFTNRVEVITPLAYNGSLVEELAAVPLTGTQKHKLLNGELRHFHALRHVSYQNEFSLMDIKIPVMCVFLLASQLIWKLFVALSLTEPNSYIKPGSLRFKLESLEFYLMVDVLLYL